MTAPKLTQAQREMLIRAEAESADGPSAYSGARLITARALEYKGFFRKVAGDYPEIIFEITDAGRAALKDGGRG